jgi:hypothetical protein
MFISVEGIRSRELTSYESVLSEDPFIGVCVLHMYALG